jgi:hypothetical protein
MLDLYIALGKWIFNLMSMFAFLYLFCLHVLWVNFHLVGLHSYASEAHSLSWIWYSLGTISLIGALNPKYRKFYKK